MEGCLLPDSATTHLYAPQQRMGSLRLGCFVSSADLYLWSVPAHMALIPNTYEMLIVGCLCTDGTYVLFLWLQSFFVHLITLELNMYLPLTSGRTSVSSILF